MSALISLIWRKWGLLFKDLNQGGEAAAFWIEHVLKHGSRHLRPYAQDTAWYEYLMLDVTLVAAIAAVLEIICMRCCCGRCVKYVIYRKSKTKIE